MSTMSGVFTSRDGFTFQRVEGGAVRVACQTTTGETIQSLVPPVEWASIVAAVAQQDGSQENLRYQKALLLHGQGNPPESADVRGGAPVTDAVGVEEVPQA